MDIEETMKAEAAARAQGGVVLGGGQPEQPTPEQLMRLAGARIRELEVELQKTQVMAQQVAAVTAALLTIMQSAVDEWDEAPDKSMRIRLRDEILDRAQGANLAMSPSEDGDGMELIVVLKENFEAHAAFHNHTEDEGEVQEGS